MDISKLRSDHAHTKEVQSGKADAAKAPNQSIKNGSDLSSNASVSNTESPEKVAWSESAQLASEALAQAKASPDVRSEKIAAL